MHLKSLVAALTLALGFANVSPAQTADGAKTQQAAKRPGSGERRGTENLLATPFSNPCSAISRCNAAKSVSVSMRGPISPSVRAIRKSSPAPQKLPGLPANTTRPSP